MTKLDKDSIVKDYEKIMKEAQNQPGIEDLMQVYGQYQKLINQSQKYLTIMKPRSLVSSNSSTA